MAVDIIMERQFPIHGFFSFTKWRQVKGFTIPWGLIAAHNDRAKENHSGQDLERLAERGGLGMMEAIAVIEDKPLVGMSMDQETALNKLSQLVATYEQNGNHKHFGVYLND